MFSLTKLFRKEDKLLCLLEASVEQARTSVQALLAASKNPEAPVAVQEIAYSRLRDRQITAEIRQEVYSSVVPTFDRADIEHLSNALYKIPKMTDKFADRFRSSPEFVRNIDFSRQLTFLDEVIDVLVQLVQCMRHGLRLQQVKLLSDKLQFIEGEADKHLQTLYKDLYSGKFPAMQVLVLKDLYELLEKLIDRCRTAGHIVVRIALQNS